MKLNLKLLLLASVFVFVYISGSFVVQSGWGWHIDNEKAANYGDFIGGLFGFISLLVIILSIYEQRNSFLLQQFKDTYSKYIVFNRNIVEKMYFTLNGIDKVVEGHHIFKLIHSQFQKAFEIVSDIVLTEENLFSDPDYQSYYKEVFKDNNLERTKIDIAYKIVYFGVKSEGLSDLRSCLRHLELDVQDKIIYKSRLLLNHNKISHNRVEEDKILLNDDKYFYGFQHSLGHYFRNLFHTIKFLDQEKLINDKYELSKLLRGQFSIYEQAVIMLNSISDLGIIWEWNNIGMQTGYITKYKLIKNIPNYLFEKIEFNDYFPEIKFEFQERSYKLLNRK